MAQVEWSKLCELFTQDDNLPVREVGSWSEDKLFFWHRYVQITTTAMVGKPRWSATNYLDLFSGPGVCRVRDSGKRIPGSPTVASFAPKQFSNIIACELDTELASACRTRLSRTPSAERCIVLEGDCNSRVDDIVRIIPDRSLTLAFIDPVALHIQFESVKRIAALGAVDIMVLFADAFDIARNVDAYYIDNPNSKLDFFLGRDSDWRTDWAGLSDRSPQKTRDLFLTVYQRQLKAIGYAHFGEQRISGPSGPLYRLVYASKNDRGLDFWNKAKNIDRSGQRELF